MVIFCAWANGLSVSAQCPQLPTGSASGNNVVLCEGGMVTLNATALNVAIGSHVDWYLVPDATQNPYDGFGMVVGSALVTGDPCTNNPAVLYIMVNPDNAQVGGPGDQCDEFIVLWTGSGGFETSDISVTNLGPGSFSWDSFIAGNAATFSCGSALPPGPVPENAILIIQSSPNNNVDIDIDALCASGLPVYIIAYDGTGACTGGYFDNNSPCSSCPVMIDITGMDCQYEIDLNYNPPGSSIDGWGWGNNGSGVFADVVPAVDIPVYNPPALLVEPYTWTIPANFCETEGGGTYFLVGIPNPPPPVGCMEISTDYFGLQVSCPSLILSGGGDVCEGNCPDNPTEIGFELVGDDVPFIADIVIMASAFPPFPINDLEITDGYTIQVCLEGLIPSFDPASGILTIPTFAIGITAAVEFVSVVSDAGCPVTVNPNSIVLNFIEGPTADAGSDNWICDNGTISLDGSIGGSATESEWTTDGDGSFSDPTDLNSTYTPGPGDISSGEIEFTLTSSDPNGVCTPATSTVLYTIYPSFTIEVGPDQTVCSNDDVILMVELTGPPSDGFWYSSGDGEFGDESDLNTFYTPGPSDIATGSVTIFYTMDNNGPCTAPDESLLVTFVNAPDVDIPQNLEGCVGDSVDVMISVSGNYTDINWSSSGDGVLVIQNDFEINYDPGPNDIANQFAIVSVMVTSGFPQCGITTFNIPINISNCDCPDVNTHPPFGPVCSVNDLLDLNELIVAADPGSWSIVSVPPGVNPATLTGSVFSTNQSDVGVYVVSYALDAPVAGCPASSMENIEVNAPIAVLAGPDQTFCRADSVLVSGAFVPQPGYGHVWMTLGDGFFDSPYSFNTVYHPGHTDSLSLGVQLVFHVTDTVCGPQEDTLNVFFSQGVLVEFFADTVTICNDPAYGSVLNFNMLITAGDMTGTWINTFGVPVNFSNPASVDFSGIAKGYYSFGYQTNSAIFPCQDSLYSIVVFVDDCVCPPLVTDEPTEPVCNSLPQLPLNAFVMAGGPGTWQLLSVPAGANPATLNGSILQINGADPGDYRLRFTFNAAPLDGCPDSTEITITVQDQPTIQLQNDTTFCAGDTMPVSSVIGGSATNVSWSSSGTGTFMFPTGTSNFYQPSPADLEAGSVQIIGTTTDTVNVCSPGKDTMLLSFTIPPFAVISPVNVVVCNDPDSMTTVNFNAVVVAGDLTGSWIDAGGSGVNLTNTAAVDFAGVMPGLYTFLYQTNSAIFPCSEHEYYFSVKVEQCGCPSVLLSQDTLSLCNMAPFEYDLLPISANADVGFWSLSSGNGNGNVIVNLTSVQYSPASSGTYNLVYRLANAVAGCPDSALLTFILDTLPKLTIEAKPCDPNDLFYSIILSTDGSTLTSDAGVLNQTGNQVVISNIPAGQDVMITATSPHGVCTDVFTITAPNCDCALMIEDLVDTLTLCPGDSFKLIPFVTGAVGFPHTYWIDQNQDTVEWFSFLVKEPGTYIWVVIDSTGCEERDTFTSRFIGPTGLVVSAISPACPDDVEGQVIVEDVLNGLPPYSIQLDNEAPVAVGVFPYLISPVQVGNHQLAITDLTGCTYEQPLLLIPQEGGVLEIGPDRAIAKGDSTQIIPQITAIGISSVAWNIISGTSDLLPFWIKPDSTISIEVIVTDTAGCIYMDEVTITVIQKAEFYIPSVFSPNHDQINDEVIVITNVPDAALLSFDIFDRWGGLVHHQDNAPPFSWDGTWDGKPMNPGVYVYRLSYKDDRGTLKIKTGDITLVR